MKTSTLLIACLISSATLNAQNFEWAKAFGGTSQERGFAISVDTYGNTYTTGYFKGTVDFDPGAGITNLSSAGAEDVFVQKLDAAGNFLWARSFGSTADDKGYAICVDAFGNVYTTGYFVGTVDFDPGPGTANLTSAGTEDVFVQKMDPSGDLLWAKAFGGTSEDIAYSIHIDASGNVYTAGYFAETVDFDPGAGTTDFTATAGLDVFVHKMDASGNFLWAKTFGGTYYDYGYAIDTDPAGNVYTVGSFRGTVDFDPGAGTTDLGPFGLSSIFVQKLDASGNFLWAKAFGGYDYDYGYSVAVDASGNVYTSGTFYGTVDFDPGAGTVNLTSAGLWDIFIQKMDTDGNFVWVKGLGGIHNDAGTSPSSTVDATGNIYTTGVFNGTVDFDPGAGTAILSSLAGFDVFVQKMDTDGNFLWATTIAGAGDNYGEDICVDVSENVYTVGHFYSPADFDPGSGTTELTPVGGTDVFVQKMGQSAVTGTYEAGFGIEAKAYPNPSNGLVQLSFEKTLDDVTVTLTDIQGKTVYSKHLDAVSNTRVDIEGPAGMYLLTVSSPKGQSVVKLVKED